MITGVQVNLMYTKRNIRAFDLYNFEYVTLFRLTTELLLLN